METFFYPEEEPKFDLEPLSDDKINEIVALEEASMKTDTTFPFTKAELEDVFKSGYLAYGYRDDSGLLIAKVGFTKSPDGKVELDVCVHPSTQGKGIGKRVIGEALELLLSDNDNLDIFLRVHPKNPAFKLYQRLGFKAHKDNSGNYEISETDHGPRITMDYEK